MTDRTVVTRLKADVSDFNRKILSAAASTKAFTKELDTSTDRATNLTQSVLALGPALVPIGAAAIPAISGLTNQLAFAAAGAGVTALALHGVGDALKAVNDYQLEPTAANFEKLQKTMRELGPAGREFVMFLQEIRPELQGLQDAAQEGLFPGAEDGIRELMTLMPQAERIVGTISSTIGDLIAEAGDNLNDPRWVEFFTFLETEARPTLLDMGRTLGNFAEGFANLWMAFDPLSDQFSASFLQMSRDFAEWTDGLDQTEGFQEFLDYVSRVGPQAWDTLGALANALLQVVEAAAPVGAATLPVIRVLADVLASIADSPVGPVLIVAAAGISALSRAVALYNVANGSAISNMLTGVRGSGPYLKTAAAGIGVLGLTMTDLDERMGISHAATLGLAGAVAGPWGAAVGAGVGLAMDFAAANDGVSEAVSKANQVLADSGSSYADQITAIDAAIAAIDKYQDSLTGDMSGVGDFFKSAKSGIEDVFGKSDYQENAEQRAKLIEQRKASSDAARAERFAEAGLTISMDGTSEATKRQLDALLKLNDSRNRDANELLTAREAQRALEAAMDDATAALKENGATLDEHTPKGRANAQALDAVAALWNDLPEASQNAEGAFDKMRDYLIRTAISFGMSEQAARDYANSVMEIPTDIGIDITQTGALTATRQAKELRTALDAISGVTETTIRTIQETFIAPTKSDPKPSLKDMLNPARKAGGGPVSGPGTGTSDDVPIWASNGEYVVKAKSVAHYGVAALDAINAQKFAGGGLVGSPAQDRYDTFSSYTASTQLDIAHKRQEILNLQKRLAEQETVGKGKSKHKRDALRGYDREVARMELAQDQADLKKMLSDNDALKAFGSQEQEQAALDAATAAADAATTLAGVKNATISTFSIGNATSAAAVDAKLAKDLAGAGVFLSLLADLKSKNASPWLLQQLINAGPTPGAIRLARQYDTDSAALARINERASQIDQYGNAYAGLVGNPAFMAPGAWNSGVTAAPISLGPLAGQLEITNWATGEGRFRLVAADAANAAVASADLSDAITIRGLG